MAASAKNPSPSLEETYKSQSLFHASSQSPKTKYLLNMTQSGAKGRFVQIEEGIDGDLDE